MNRDTIPTVPEPVTVASVIRALESEREELLANLTRVSELVLIAAECKVRGDDAAALSALNTAADLEYDVYGDCSAISPLLESWEATEPLHASANVEVDGILWRATITGSDVEVHFLAGVCWVYAGHGRWNDGITDCSAPLGDAVYSALDDALRTALEVETSIEAGAS